MLKLIFMWSYDFITEMFLTLYSEMDIFFYYPLNSHFKCFTFMCVDCNFFSVHMQNIFSHYPCDTTEYITDLEAKISVEF